MSKDEKPLPTEHVIRLSDPTWIQLRLAADSMKMSPAAFINFLLTSPQHTILPPLPSLPPPPPSLYMPKQFGESMTNELMNLLTAKIMLDLSETKKVQENKMLETFTALFSAQMQQSQQYFQQLLMLNQTSANSFVNIISGLLQSIYNAYQEEQKKTAKREYEEEQKKKGETKE